MKKRKLVKTRKRKLYFMYKNYKPYSYYYNLISKETEIGILGEIRVAPLWEI